MLTYEDKEFIRDIIPRIPYEGLRAVKIAIALRKLLVEAEGKSAVDLDAVKEITLGFHEIGHEYAPDEMRNIIEVWNEAVEVANQG